MYTCVHGVMGKCQEVVLVLTLINCFVFVLITQENNGLLYILIIFMLIFLNSVVGLYA